MKVTVVPYDPGWVTTFETERGILEPLLPADAAIEHVGSTSIPEMPAKPIVDIAVGLSERNSLDEACSALMASGRYVHFRFLERWRPDRRYLVSLRDRAERSRWPDVIDNADWSNEMPLELRLCQVHMLRRGSEMLKDLIGLRELLIRDPAARKAYAETKLALSSKKWRSSREYAICKDAIIERLRREAGLG